MSELNSSPPSDDLVDLAEAVREALRPKPPAEQRRTSTAILFQLPLTQFDELTAWRTQIARELGVEQVTDAEMLPALVQVLLSSEDLKPRVTEMLRASL